MANKCCFYRKKLLPKTLRLLCTSGKTCPDIEGYEKLSEWDIEKCEDCKFEEVSVTGFEGPQLAELNEARILLAESQGRLGALARLALMRRGIAGPVKLEPRHLEEVELEEERG